MQSSVSVSWRRHNSLFSSTKFWSLTFFIFSVLLRSFGQKSVNFFAVSKTYLVFKKVKGKADDNDDDAVVVVVVDVTFD